MISTNPKGVKPAAGRISDLLTFFCFMVNSQATKVMPDMLNRSMPFSCVVREGIRKSRAGPCTTTSATTVSPQASFVTGIDLVVDGGWIAQIR